MARWGLSAGVCRHTQGPSRSHQRGCAKAAVDQLRVASRGVLRHLGTCWGSPEGVHQGTKGPAGGRWQECAATPGICWG